MTSSFSVMTSAMALSVSRSKIRQTSLKHGVVIFATFSLILIFGTIVPSGFSTAASL
jgi:uncharacterized membrane protein